MELNPEKCHLLLLTSEKVNMNVQDLNIIKSKTGYWNR